MLPAWWICGNLTCTMDSMFDVVERLHSECGAQLARTQILAVAHQCRHLLDSIQAESRPELLERLARQRLTALPPDQPAKARHDTDAGARPTCSDLLSDPDF